MFVGIGLNLVRGGTNAVPPLVQFALWFLATGSWNTSGQWVDQADWGAVWFLNSGTIDVYGVWDDTRAW